MKWSKIKNTIHMSVSILWAFEETKAVEGLVILLGIQKGTQYWIIYISRWHSAKQITHAWKTTPPACQGRSVYIRFLWFWVRTRNMLIELSSACSWYNRNKICPYGTAFCEAALPYQKFHVNVSFILKTITLKIWIYINIIVVFRPSPRLLL